MRDPTRDRGLRARPFLYRLAVHAASARYAFETSTAQHALTGGRQPTNEPVGFHGIGDPRLRPTVRDAGFNGFAWDFAPVAIEQRQLATGLIKPPRQIANLRLGRPKVAARFARFLRN